MDSLIKGNFQPKETVKPDEQPPDPKAEYRKKAIENIGGSMVFVEREQLIWDGEK